MSFDEFLCWQSYIETNGPISPILRNDAAIARMASAMTGAKMKAFMPWPKEREKEVSFDEIAGMILGAAAHNNREK